MSYILLYSSQKEINSDPNFIKTLHTYLMSKEIVFEIAPPMIGALEDFMPGAKGQVKGLPKDITYTAGVTRHKAAECLRIWSNRFDDNPAFIFIKVDMTAEDVRKNMLEKNHNLICEKFIQLEIYNFFRENLDFNSVEPAQIIPLHTQANQKVKSGTKPKTSNQYQQLPTEADDENVNNTASDLSDLKKDLIDLFKSCLKGTGCLGFFERKPYAQDANKIISDIQISNSIEAIQQAIETMQDGCKAKYDKNSDFMVRLDAAETRCTHFVNDHSFSKK